MSDLRLQSSARGTGRLPGTAWHLRKVVPRLPGSRTILRPKHSLGASVDNGIRESERSPSSSRGVFLSGIQEMHASLRAPRRRLARWSVLLVCLAATALTGCTEGNRPWVLPPWAPASGGNGFDLHNAHLTLTQGLLSPRGQLLRPERHSHVPWVLQANDAEDFSRRKGARTLLGTWVPWASRPRVGHE